VCTVIVAQRTVNAIANQRPLELHMIRANLRHSNRFAMRWGSFNFVTNV
jgi:hypothetical protein